MFNQQSKTARKTNVFQSKQPVEPDSAKDISEAETLRRLSKMSRFNPWLYSKIEPWIGQRILEVGCGLGNITRFFADRPKVVGIDFSDDHLQEFRQRNPDLDRIELHRYDAGNPALVDLGRGSFDTIVCLNVLEHVEHDERALESFWHLLEPGGHLALLVPAFPALYGTLDSNASHMRRYTRPGLDALLNEQRFNLLKMKYFNLFGLPGWWFCGKILKQPILPANGLGWYERLMPVFRFIEELTGPPLGLSLIAIARKPEGETPNL